MKITVIGGMNLDITGSVTGGMRLRDSNPGRIRLSPGGVGRNIASALKGCGAEVSLVTCLCDDLPGETLKASCLKEGIDLTLSYRAAGASSCYMALHGADGDLVCAVNDMEVMDEFPASHIRKTAEEINLSDACVIDANLNEPVLDAVFDSVTVPVIADPVSMHKCGKLMPYLSRLTAIKPNLDEAKELTGKQTPEEAGAELLLRGVRNVYISLGAQGLYACSAKERGFLRPACAFSCVTNGAGDSLTAGIAIGLARGLGTLDAAACGMDSCRAFLERKSGLQ